MFNIVKYQLYLLQLEGYELRRYLRLLFKKGILPPKETLRKKLVWTLKARSLFFLSLCLHLLTIFLLLYHISDGFFVFSIKYLVLAIGLLVAVTPLYFLLYVLVLIFLWPADFVFKKWIVLKAKTKIVSLKSKIKIIGIVGSYGKTTMKEVLATVLKVKFRVASTPESVNTPLGVARWILEEVNESTQILVVEMGEHYKGDILELCQLTSPNIGVVSGINEAHLERMGNRQQVVATIFEIVEGMNQEGVLVLNGDDANILNNYKQFIRSDFRVEFYSSKNPKSLSFVGGQKWKFYAETFSWQADLENVGKINFKLLGEYGLGLADCAFKIAIILGMTNEEIKQGLENIRPIEHRLQPSLSQKNILVIDDAYNGNSDGVREAINVLSRFLERRKIYVTPGLVETGQASREVHLEIGRQLASVADVVILIKNSVTQGIEMGIKNSELTGALKKPKIIWFKSAQEAHAALKDIVEPNDVVLFQNDWGDQYL